MNNKLKSRLGRVKRDIERQLPNYSVDIQSLFEIALKQAQKLIEQEQHSKNKLYSLHAPEVECISKGKAHKPYEFGVKASIAVTNGRGRPGKYGTRYTKEEIKRLPLNKETVHLYGREQQVNYRTAEAKARFLNGQSVCFVWCEFEDSKGKKRPRLLLSTDMQLSGLDIIVAYEKRWSIEPLFNQLKND